MPRLPSGGCLRGLLAVARRTRLSGGPRRALGGPRRGSCGPGCAPGTPAGADLLRGELDRFGGVSVRLARLDHVDAATFHRALQGKCVPGRGLPAPGRLTK